MLAFTKNYVLGGTAVFKIAPSPAFRKANPTALPEYTYKVRRMPAWGKFPETTLVSLRTKNDHDAVFIYACVLDADGSLRPTGNSRVNIQSLPMRLLAGVLKYVWQGRQAEIAASGCQVYMIKPPEKGAA